MKNVSKLTLSALVIASMAFVSCEKDEPVAAAPEKASIYTRLGGTEMVTDPDDKSKMIEKGRLSFRTVVNNTVGLILADVGTEAPGNLSAHFAPLLAETGNTQATNLAKLKDNLTDFFSFNTGGTNPVNEYKGLNMVDAHNPEKNPRMGTKANDADYDKFIGYVGGAANMAGVETGSELYNDVVVVLQSLRKPIVQK